MIECGWKVAENCSKSCVCFLCIWRASFKWRRNSWPKIIYNISIGIPEKKELVEIQYSLKIQTTPLAI